MVKQYFIHNYIVRKYFFIFLTVYINSAVFSQSTKFNKSYLPDGSSYTNSLNCFFNNHEYWLIGLNYNIYPKCISVFSLDSTGDQQNNLIYGKTGISYFVGGEEGICRNGNYFYLGSSHINYNEIPTEFFSVIYKFSETFDTVFTKINYVDTLTCEILNNIYLNGYIYSTGVKAYSIDDADHYDIIVLKSDTLGNLIWMKNFGGSSMDIGYKLTKTYDDNLLLASIRYGYYTPNNPFYNNDCQWWVLKLDTAGNMIWNRSFGNPDIQDGRPFSLIETSDTCYIITGSLAVEMPDVAGRLRGRILKIDRSGNIVWDRLYGDKTVYTYASIIKEKSNNDIVGIFNNGANSGYQTPYNPIIYRMTSNGDIIWHRIYYFNNKPEVFVSVLRSFDFTSDGGYIFAGYGIDTDSIPSQRSWVIKTDSLGFDGTYYQGDTTLGITITTDTVCYGDSAKLVFHVTGKSAPYSILLNNGNGKNEIYYSPYFESYAYDSLYIYPADSNSYYNFTATVTDPWGNTVTDNFTVWVNGCGTGVEEAIKENELIEVFPNPASTELHVKVNGVIEGSYIITIYGAQGKTVDLITTKKTETMIDISKYPQGIYWIRVLGNNIVRSEKVIILKND